MRQWLLIGMVLARGFPQPALAQDEHSHQMQPPQPSAEEQKLVTEAREAKTLVVRLAAFVYDLTASPAQVYGLIIAANQSGAKVGSLLIGGLSSEGLNQARYTQLRGLEEIGRLPEAELRPALVRSAGGKPQAQLVFNKPLPPNGEALLYLKAPLAAFSGPILERSAAAFAPAFSVHAMQISVTLLLPPNTRFRAEGQGGWVELNRHFTGSNANAFVSEMERLANTACLLSGRSLPREQETFMYLWAPVALGKALPITGHLLPAGAAPATQPDWTLIGLLGLLGIIAFVAILARFSNKGPRTSS